MKKLVGGTKDADGMYIPVPREPEPTSVPKAVDPLNLSIDELLMRGVEDIYGIMRAIRSDIATGMPNRETVQNLKDCLSMLSDLKKREKELLDSMTDEQLEKMLK